MNIRKICVCLLILESVGRCASKPHTVVFGKWTTIKWLSGDDDNAKAEDLKIRALIVDGRTKEWTTGIAHDVTERTFVVQRMYRLNDSLPQESGSPRWQWERGTWLLVDRVSGKTQAINLTAFDSGASSVSWFRDYAAYCGLTDDGNKSIAVVMQLGRRKPVLKKELSGFPGEKTRACIAPEWQRNPARVTFAPSGQSITYTVATRAIDLVPASDEEDDP